VAWLSFAANAMTRVSVKIHLACLESEL